MCGFLFLGFFGSGSIEVGAGFLGIYVLFDGISFMTAISPLGNL